MSYIKGNCSSCRFAGLQAPQVCARWNRKVDPNGYCDEHRRSVTVCSICGNVILSNGIVDNSNIICANCYSIIHTCQVCKNAHICTFETDSSPLPRMIQKEIRHGNMTAVTQVMNPERIHITCEKGCKCFDTEKGCLRQIGFCGNQEVFYND